MRIWRSWMFEEVRSYLDYTSAAPKLFSQLMAQSAEPFRVTSSDNRRSGIYVLYDDDTPVYVGRTRNLQGRFRAHVTKSHNSASFALKRTRAQHAEIKKATYKATNSRQAIVEHPVYGATFLREIEAIRGMQFKFLEVTDPIDQYLLELFATMEFGLELTGFDSH